MHGLVIFDNSFILILSLALDLIFALMLLNGNLVAW